MILQEFTEQDQLPKIQKDCSKGKKNKLLRKNNLLLIFTNSFHGELKTKAINQFYFTRKI